MTVQYKQPPSAQAEPVRAPPSARAAGFAPMRWWKAPFWVLALLTGAKSFVDNPILGSRRLNRAGLHAGRAALAHRMARWRRSRLASDVPAQWRAAFDRDGYVVVPDYLPDEVFRDLRSGLFDAPLESRAQQQGDTVTRRVAVGPALLRRFPALARLTGDPRWQGLLRYVAATRSEPLYYLQTIFGGAADAPRDPQTELHADTFHPSMKAWLFLTDVGENDRPLTYVAGSHLLTPARRAWERRRSVEVLDSGDRLSQRGSLRVGGHELAGLKLPQPTRFCVAANTLVVIDTCGFHARATSDKRSTRVELWAFSRRTPFLPWTGGDVLSWRPVAARRAEWLWAAVDWLDRRGWVKQHWRPAGLRRAAEP